MQHPTDAPPATFFRVPLALIELGTLLPCDLWLRRPGTSPLLYRSRDLPFTEENRARLLASGVESVWISFREADAWTRYVENKLRARIRDTTIALPERAAILVESSRTIMREILENPFDKDARPRVDNLSEAISEMTTSREHIAATIRLLEHDYYTYTHSVHVAIYAAALARVRGWDAPDVLAALAKGVLMHDAGKVNLPPSIINKPGKLDEREWELVRKHPEDGAIILTRAGFDDSLTLEMAELHHERLDGSGYPHGHVGGTIDEATRMVAICDAYDAMTTDRAYQNALPGAEALAILRGPHRARYDQRILEDFIRLLLDPKDLRGR